MTEANKTDIQLQGVPETLLWPLGMRAHISRTEPEFFSDPMSIELVDRIDADFAKFGKPNHWHAIRAKYSDSLLRAFLEKNPAASIVSLGEGLDTQFWRVDNGQLNWISVDLPESIVLRDRFLPAHERITNIEASALDPKWMDQVNSDNGLFVVMAGLLMYFEPDDILAMLRGMSERFDGSRTELFFDTIPPWIARKTKGKGWKPTKRYHVPVTPFGIRRSEMDAFASKVPGMEILSATAYPKAYPERSYLFNLLASLPWLSDNGSFLVHAKLA